MSTLTVTLIQSSLHWEDKLKNLQHFEEKINALKDRTEVVILPEMFSTGFSIKPAPLAEKMDGLTVEWMKKMSREKKVILTGSVIIEEGGLFYNRLIWMLPNGQYGVYDKRHRFAFAGEHEAYTAGTNRLIASVKGWRINLMVCYDLRFPVWSRQQVDGSWKEDNLESAKETLEYDLLIYVANWPEKRKQVWKTLLQARAIENQSYVIGLNRVGNDGNDLCYSGDSIIVDPLGTVLFTKADEEITFTYTLEKQQLEDVRSKFPFWKDADEFNLLT